MTPSVFITYHSDLCDAIPAATSFLFADDVAATMAGQMGIKYSDQCLDLEKRLTTFFNDLEYYSVLAVQPINYNKTQIMWTARAVNYYPNPRPSFKCGGHIIEWTNNYKYLGYWITTKLGWYKLIDQVLMKIRQRTALVNSCKFAGVSNVKTKRILFSSFVYPLFAWLFALIPLFTRNQQSELSHTYFTCLKRVYRCLYWEDLLFSVLYKEWSLEMRCIKYCERYSKALSKSEDGQLLLEQLELCTHRQSWLNGNIAIWQVWRNQRYINRDSVLGICLDWCTINNMDDSVPAINQDDLDSLAMFPQLY